MLYNGYPREDSTLVLGVCEKPQTSPKEQVDPHLLEW
jgi:hypothetical protein